MSATLSAGQSLYPGDSLKSENGVYTLVFQQDGNVVLYDNEDNALWATATDEADSASSQLIFQEDGNLVLYNADGGINWSSSTDGSGDDSAYLAMSDDGHFQLICNDEAYWGSLTQDEDEVNEEVEEEE